MKAVRVILLSLGTIVATIGSYLIYPLAYSRAWSDLIAFCTNEATRQVVSLALLIVAFICLVAMVVTIRRPAPPRPHRSPNVD